MTQLQEKLPHIIKFPSVEQYRNVIKNIIWKSQFQGMDTNDIPIMDRNAVPPVLKYQGTVKLHGTNSSVVLSSNGLEVAQSRNRVLHPGKDNAGFWVFCEAQKDWWFQYAQALTDIGYTGNKFVVYGEWCGEGIQSGVAISSLPKMFVIFAIKEINEKEDYTRWHYDDLPPLVPHPRIKNITDFPTFDIEIDFSKPHLSQNILSELTLKVEEQCPVGFQLGKEGIGEGIVWKCVSPGWKSSKYWFKVKGDKHSVTKVKTLAAIDVEKIKCIEDFVDNTVTIQRLQQGIEYLKEQDLELSRRTTGDFLSWIFADIIKEEADTLDANNLSRKDIGSRVGTQARKWYFNYLDTHL